MPTDIGFVPEFFDDMRMIAETEYHGLTYPKLFASRLARCLWKRFCCRRKMHLWDECVSGDGKDGVPPHTLICDACGIMVGIGEVLTEDEACRRVNEYYDNLKRGRKHD